MLCLVILRAQTPGAPMLQQFLLAVLLYAKQPDLEMELYMITECLF